MKKLIQTWNDISIRKKIVLMVGSIMAATWVLICVVVMQQRHFSQESSIIMNDYMEITSFLDAFSAENVCLEVYMRENSPENAEEDYQNATAETNRCLIELAPDLSVDRQQEYVLKRAINNAMAYYRFSQQLLLEMSVEEDNIPQYLSMKTQAAYIDGYTRELLYSRMEQGDLQWREIATANDMSTRMSGALLTIGTALMLFALWLLVHSVLAPLTELGNAANRISAGQYDAPPLKIRGKDEVGRAAASFNLMQREVRKTVRALEDKAELEKHLREKEAEAAQMQRALQEGRFAQLQSQINPHFLFNTLSTISALAREEGAPLSEELIIRLSSFFRYSLESNEKMVTLKQEMQLLRDYMELQETRYGDRIRMEIHSDPELEHVLVPKFILQPLVENAILHGLRACTAGGCIRVRVRRNKGNIAIYVTDNGCGFDTRIRRTDEKRKSVGLENIAERMQLNNGRLDVFSIRGRGTCARITIKEASA